MSGFYGIFDDILQGFDQVAMRARMEFDVEIQKLQERFWLLKVEDFGSSGCPLEDCLSKHDIHAFSEEGFVIFFRRDAFYGG